MNNSNGKKMALLINRIPFKLIGKLVNTENHTIAIDFLTTKSTV